MKKLIKNNKLDKINSHNIHKMRDPELRITQLEFEQEGLIKETPYIVKVLQLTSRTITKTYRIGHYTCNYFREDWNTKKWEQWKQKNRNQANKQKNNNNKIENKKKQRKELYNEILERRLSLETKTPTEKPHKVMTPKLSDISTTQPSTTYSTPKQTKPSLAIPTLPSRNQRLNDVLQERAYPVCHKA